MVRYLPRRTLVSLACGALIIAVTPTLLAGAAPSAPSAPLLRWAWNAGDTLRYRITTTSDVATTNDMTVQSREVETRRFSVLDVDAEGVATIEVIIESAHIERTARGETTVLDSDSERLPDAKEPADSFARLARVGQPYIARIDPRGQFLAVQAQDGHKKTWERLHTYRKARGLPDALPPTEEASVQSTFERAQDPSAWQTLWIPLPDKPLALGKAYAVRHERPSLFRGKLIFDITATRQTDDAHGNAVFDQTTQARGDFPATAGSSIQLDALARAGTLVFSPGGHLVRHSETLDLKAKIEVTSPGKQPQTGTFAGIIKVEVERIE